MTHLVYWGTMLIIPAAALIVGFSAFFIARAADARNTRRSTGHHTPAE
jgi:hypothetical protein